MRHCYTLGMCMHSTRISSGLGVPVRQVPKSGRLRNGRTCPSLSHLLVALRKSASSPRMNGPQIPRIMSLSPPRFKVLQIGTSRQLAPFILLPSTLDFEFVRYSVPFYFSHKLIGSVKMIFQLMPQRSPSSLDTCTELHDVHGHVIISKYLVDV
jgi:hypothetical protein